ncbi:MAG: energy-coupling factor transporter ATPase [Clostridiales bacterium]|nr:energy-coupling factor transporter ATPase [Clostridiales bacterium]
MPIEINHLTHTYMPGTPFETRALFDVSLSVRDGEFVGIIGHTGSGKSTLIAHLNALIRPEPGHVIVSGVDVGQKGQSLIEIRREVGLVFQYPEYQLFEETVEKDVGYGPRNLGLPDAEVKIRVAEALSQVGIPEELFQKSPFELSGGQKRRVAIAGVLAMRPSTLVLDEPVAGLDPAGREELLKLIQDIHRGGVTVIMVTHSMDDAARLCGRLVVLNRGEVAFDAPPAEVFRHGDELIAMGLDVPECVKLVKKLNMCGFHVPDSLFRIEDVKRAILKEVRGC